MKSHERKMMIAWEAIEKRKLVVALRKPVKIHPSCISLQNPREM